MLNMQNHISPGIRTMTATLLAAAGLFLEVPVARAAEAVASAFAARFYSQGLYPSAVPHDPAAPGPRTPGPFTVYTRLTGVTGIRDGAIAGEAVENGYVFKNMRFQSAQTTYDDYVRGYYKFDLATQNLVPEKFEKAPGVGIFEEEYQVCIKDNADPLYFSQTLNGPNQFAQATSHTFQSGTDYYLKMAVGQRLAFAISVVSGRTYRIVISLEDGTVVGDQLGQGGGYAFYYEISALVAGSYKFRIEPVSPATSFSYTFRFANENAFTTSNVVSGNTISASLGGGIFGFGRPYRKFRVALLAGQTISYPGDSDVTLILVNSRGSIVAKSQGLPTEKTVTESGDYYIVMFPEAANSPSTESYSGTVTITNPLTFTSWSAAHGLVWQKDRPTDDPDGDGNSNLIEYALGLDPTKNDGGKALAQTVSPGQQTIRYQKPVYLTGVSVTPQFADANFQWQDAAAASDGTENGNPMVKAAISRPMNGKGFARIKVTQSP